MISISVCMIVKNESNVLARCLDSLDGLYEELIIVDTGSVDDTKEIAGRYTDKVYDYEWIDDFADARNYAFEKATKDYIYSVDADEVLDAVNRMRFLELKEKLLPEIEIVQMWYVNNGRFTTTENFAKEYRPKLYKRLRKFQWIDPVHESVNLNPVVYDSEIEILHLPEGSHGKRDFHVFEKTAAQGKTLSRKLHKMYARELMLAGEEEDFERAADYFLMSAFDEARSVEERNEAYAVLAHHYRMAGNTAEFFKWSLKNICTAPCAEVCNGLGLFYLGLGDVQEALVWFQNASSETEAIIDAKSAGEFPLSMMIKCYEKLAGEDEWMKDVYLGEIERLKGMLDLQEVETKE